jgi:hypothetical protein
MVAEKVPAAMCSLIGTAKLNGLDPESYALRGPNFATPSMRRPVEVKTYFAFFFP